MLSLILTASFAVVAQKSQPSAPETKPTPPNNKKAEQPKAVDLSKNATAEQVAETAIFFYGGGGGRQNLQQIRRTTIEDGKLNLTDASGANQQVNYERRIMRGDNLEKEKIRLDQEFPNAKYALIYSDNKIIGLYNESAFTPREDAAKAFQNQIWHGLEALLRYKENSSTLQLVGREKIRGVDLYILEVTDKENRKTTFYISAKTFRVLWLEYTEDGVKYTRKFYDYRYAQGTLVPYRTVLLANDKQVEESNVSTATFGQKLDDEIFKSN
ncbi:MAG: hypothetical protein ACR2GD_05620 [Pyrinomonadaceae bacterium]